MSSQMPETEFEFFRKQRGKKIIIKSNELEISHFYFVLLFARHNCLALNCNVVGEIGTLFDYIFSRVLGKVAHCIVKLENFLNMVSFEIFSAAAEIETASCIVFSRIWSTIYGSAHSQCCSGIAANFIY
ncbi:hypothetical protein T01_7286 [Trichinella spiralis]|uniref:Uncharacterized protein n=1 Tax=Trichinella spiralis TaxID=6334 RepID=A0A0V1AR04_TRISP|nr:hypothetical protein T01_7286 [Trichinella spiralis]